MNHFFKKLLGLSVTLEPSGLAKPKANHTTEPNYKSTYVTENNYQDWLKNQTIGRMQKEIEERNKKEVEEKYRQRLTPQAIIRMKAREELEKRWERYNRRVSKVLNSFENQMDYVEDCLYELADMSEPLHKLFRRKVTHTHYQFSFQIRQELLSFVVSTIRENITYIDGNSSTELSQTMFQIFSILKSANLRIKSRLPKSYITFTISGNIVVLNVYFSRKRIKWYKKHQPII
jgi:hypothetical protein